MTGKPPSPTAVSSPSIVPDAEPGVVTTAQLITCIEDALDCDLDEAAIEDLLVQLDRIGYVEWVAITRGGDHCWDLSESPDRIADAIATAIAGRVRSWAEERAP